ncbi:MAG TPA: hypothetical protein DD670_06505 [Planctomycetaceae bacterium]|nr:hypothetical protein [Planctomycetaceae bacterium]
MKFPRQGQRLVAASASFKVPFLGFGPVIREAVWGAEAALRQSHDELQAIYDQALEGIIIVDNKTANPLRANSAFCRLLDYTDESVHSISTEMLHPPEVLPTVLEYLDAVKEGGITRIDDLPFLRKDGSRVYVDVVLITSLAYEQRQRGGPRIECHTSVDFDRLPPILENAIYRMVQEALTNACTHSKSTKVRVSLVQERQDLRVEVQDWGVGFDTQAIGQGHFGLESIRQRVRLLGGRLRIDSKPGSGTLLQVVVPILEKQFEE